VPVAAVVLGHSVPQRGDCREEDFKDGTRQRGTTKETGQ
jgi:hypothetical protein